MTAMLNFRQVQIASAIGTVLQLAMVVVGHFVPAVAAQFAAGGMAISAIAGVLYGRSVAAAGAAALGGAFAGGECALIGIAVSCALGDVGAMVLLFGTLASAVTGLIGGVAGRFVPGVRANA
jgi:hypothetical protein